MTSTWLNEAIVTGRIDHVSANTGAAGERINDARRHIASARSLADTDATLALSACHDAIRKAITGHMVASGCRPKAGDGAHRVVLEYCHHELSAVVSVDDVEAADSIRRDRATAEYGDFASGRREARPLGRRRRGTHRQRDRRSTRVEVTAQAQLTAHSRTFPTERQTTARTPAF